MTAPTVASYLAACRRNWVVVLLVALSALGVSLALPPSDPARATIGDLVFTVQVGGEGQASEGEARIQEGDLAARRLNAYASVIIGSEEVRAVLREAGVEIPDVLDAVSNASTRLLITADGTGRMTVAFENEDLSPDVSLQLVGEIQRILAREVPALDSQQVRPSIVDEPLVVAPRPGVLETPPDASVVRDVALPLMVGLLLGLGLVYLLDWRYRRIENRQDLEERLQVGVLGESAGRPGDLDALALALRRVPQSSRLAILAAATGKRDPAVLVEGIRAASRALPGTEPDQGESEARGTMDAAPRGGSSVQIEVLDLTSPRGVHTELLVRAPSADVVAIVVEYGRTPMRDLESMLIRLSDASDTPLRVIGVRT